MKIRLKLTLQFVLIAAVINLAAFISIYLLSADYRREEFYDRLYGKAVNTAKLLIEVQEIDRTLLRIIDQNTASLPEEKVVIYNYKNEELYNSLDDELIDYSPEFLDRIRLEDEIRFRDGEKESLGILYADRYDRFVVIASAYDVYGFRKLKNLRWVLILVFLGNNLLTFGGGWLFAGGALKPIKRVIDEVGHISSQNLSARVNEGNGTDEIAQLAHNFNRMLSRLEEAFVAQKSFVSHASHELRTPLTAITGQIEVALMNQRSIEEYKTVFYSVLEDIKSLTQLTNGLLTLAQTNTETIVANFTRLRIDEILLQARASLLKKYEKADIIIEFENLPDEEKELLVRGNEQLLKSALMNLLDNACKFSQGQSVKTVVGFRQQLIIIKIQDQGIGIPPADLAQIFEPFFRGRNAHTFKGYGLGLSLTKKILDMHRAILKIQSTAGEGTAIHLSLPKI